jgi:hypothetical protein
MGLVVSTSDSGSAGITKFASRRMHYRIYTKAQLTSLGKICLLACAQANQAFHPSVVDKLILAWAGG